MGALEKYVYEQRRVTTVRIRTFDHDGNATGDVLLGPEAARLVPGNVEAAPRGARTGIDASGGVSHGGVARLGTEESEADLSVWARIGRGR